MKTKQICRLYTT